MLVGELITDEIPPLKVNDTVELALEWMEQFKVSHLAVVNNRVLILIKLPPSAMPVAVRFQT